MTQSIDSQIDRDLALYNGAKEPEDELPHYAAIALVWQTHKTAIRDLETKFAVGERKKQTEYVSAESRWWFDTDARGWEVQRPFGPGTIDSTHLFYVSYFINKKEVARWWVNTEMKTAEILKVPETTK